MSWWRIAGRIGDGGSGDAAIGLGTVGSVIAPVPRLPGVRSIVATTRPTRNVAVILLLSGATTYERSDTVGHLIVPRQWNDPAKLDLRPGRWAMDCGAWSGFDEGAFLRMIEAYHPHHADQGYQGCLFVTAPDVVADAASTLRRWPFWSRLLRGLGYAPAFVAQNGLTAERVPWEEFGTLFIGGDDVYKDGPEIRTLCAYAKAKGKWVHWGRVNGRRRYELAVKAGADSIDGTGFSVAPIKIRQINDWAQEINEQPELALGLGDSTGE